MFSRSQEWIKEGKSTQIVFRYSVMKREPLFHVTQNTSKLSSRFLIFTTNMYLLLIQDGVGY